MRKVYLAPSILSADLTNLESAVGFMEKNGADILHYDVMDGSYAPQITYGEPVLKSLRAKTKLPIDVHLMTVRPEDKIESFADSGADWITFHWEAALHHHRLVERIHALGKKAGIALNPATPVSFLKGILPYVDLVLLMSVNPGYGGQKFIEGSLKKVRELADIVNRDFAPDKKPLISVDGGINAKNAQSIIDAGADVLVSGSAFFSGSLTRGALHG
jgi:ribulose-phosphate 3-epimerase